MQRELDAGSLTKAEVTDWSTRVYGKQEFAGAGKTNTGLLVPLERRLARFVLPRIPCWLETYHLTLLTPVWSIMIAVFGYLAARDLRWLWLVNLMIVLHYFTDHFDGKLGKFRDTGLRKWGFYLVPLAAKCGFQPDAGAVRVQCLHVSHVSDASGRRRIQGQPFCFWPD